MTPFSPNTSFPFFQIAIEEKRDYAEVLQIAKCIEAVNDKITQGYLSPLFCRIQSATIGERNRRIEVGNNRESGNFPTCEWKNNT